MARGKSLFTGAQDDGWNSGRRRQTESDLDITPMIDVTFLLLIFFMVTSTMQGKPDLDVPTAQYGVGVQSSRSTVVTIRARGVLGSETPAILLGDGRGPEGTLDEVRQYVEEGVREHRNEVVIKADRLVPHGFVQRVAKSVAEIEGVQFSIGVQDQRASR